MRILTGQYERNIDDKNRIQLPSELRRRIDAERDGAGFYVTFGEHPGTLSIFTEGMFEQIAERTATEFIPGPESQLFERQFFGLAAYVEPDGQHRILLPERLKKKAGLQTEVFLVGQKFRIDIWNRAAFEQSLGIDWEGDGWPKEWSKFLRSRPAVS